MVMIYAIIRTLIQITSTMATLFQQKLRILHRSYEIFKESADLCMLKEFDVFCEHEKDWLDDYALFMAGKDAHGGACWLEWEDDLRDPDEEIKAAWRERLADSIEYYKYIQFIFFRQWNAIRDYAHVNGIKIVGDIPIFVALDSADVWANRELFQLERMAIRPLLPEFRRIISLLQDSFGAIRCMTGITTKRHIMTGGCVVSRVS